VSAAGQGSSFEILLPCSGEAPPYKGDTALSETTGETARLAGTILVVEDEDALRFAVCKKLRREGFTVIEAANGKNAVDLFRADAAQIDVVLLDMTLPGMVASRLASALLILSIVWRLTIWSTP
jgi:PleD family two-component response regulator